MWITWLVAVLAVSGWLGWLWITNLSTKYQHTAASTCVLLLLGGASGYGGWAVLKGLAPDWSGFPRFLLWFLISALFFLVSSYGVVQLWCSLLTLDIQQKISALEEEEDKILRQIDYMRWFPDHSEKNEVHNVSMETDEETFMKSYVERWELGGGATRVRALKVLEWKSEASELNDDELERQLVILAEEIARESDKNKREQLKVKTYVIKLELCERTPVNDMETVKVQGVSKAVRGEELRRRLQEVHREIQMLRQEKDEFFRSKITLGQKAGRKQ